MALDTAAKRRSALGVWQPWIAALPSPTDTPGVLDQADQQHAAWTYSGILAALLVAPSGRRRVVIGDEVWILAADGTVVYHYELLHLPQLRTYVWEEEPAAPVARPLPALRTYAVHTLPVPPPPARRRLPQLRRYAVMR